MEWDKNKDRNERIRNLLSEGNSITSIAKDVGCSKGTVYYYAEKCGWWHNDEVIKKRKEKSSTNSKLASESNKTAWHLKRLAIIEEAKKEWVKIKKDPKMCMFLGLYWGEGNKRQGNIGVVNNDPGIIRFCYDFITEYVDNKISVEVRCYPEQDWDESKEFWQNLLGVEVKIKEKKWLGKKRRCWSEHGVCYMRTSDWKFYLKIITWIGLWRAEITGTELEIDSFESISSSGLYSTMEYR